MLPGSANNTHENGIEGLCAELGGPVGECEFEQRRGRVDWRRFGRELLLEGQASDWESARDRPGLKEWQAKGCGVPPCRTRHRQKHDQRNEEPRDTTRSTGMPIHGGYGALVD